MKEALQVYVPDRVTINRRTDGHWDLKAEIELDEEGTVGEVMLILQDASLMVHATGHEQKAGDGTNAVAVFGLFPTGFTLQLRSVIEPDENGFRLKTRVRP